MLEPFNPYSLEFDALEDETIAIEQAGIYQAFELSDSVLNEKQQWQAYLNALAVLSFEQWLRERAPEMTLSWEDCSILEPQYAGLIKAVFKLRVDAFQVCLITVGTGMDEKIPLSKFAVNLPGFKSHLYIAISVFEELEQARILGFIPYEQLIERLQSVNLQVESNWTYRVPLSWLNRNLDDLLLSLRWLNPIPIDSEIPSNLTASCLDKVRRKLDKYHPNRKNVADDIWKLLTWEEASILFSHIDLFQVQQPENQTKPLVNVAVWLSDRLDEVAQEWSWVLLPSFNIDRFRWQAAAAMRSPLEELDDILTQLERSGTDISPQARGAYQDIKLENETLRLYAVTWSLLSPENTPLWKLLLILGGVEGRYPPHGTSLQVSDQTRVLVERVCDQQTDAPYLYVRVAGTWEDIFSVKITLPDETSITLPPLAFHPQSNS